VWWSNPTTTVTLLFRIFRAAYKAFKLFSMTIIPLSFYSNSHTKQLTSNTTHTSTLHTILSLYLSLSFGLLYSIPCCSSAVVPMCFLRLHLASLWFSPVCFICAVVYCWCVVLLLVPFSFIEFVVIVMVCPLSFSIEVPCLYYVSGHPFLLLVINWYSLLKLCRFKEEKKYCFMKFYCTHIVV
jgi:hypothetical protein